MTGPKKVMQELKTEPLRWRQLTEEDILQFIKQGYLVVREVFQREVAERIVPMVWAELDINPNDPSTWTEPIVTLRKVLEREPISQIFTSRYLGAVDDLCGSGRWRAPKGVGYWPILLPGFANPPWCSPKGGWHIDYSLDRCRINSPELGLVSIEIFTDIEPGGGGTAVRVGSHRYIARIFAEAEPDGLTLCELNLRVGGATEHLPVVEVTSQAGDIILMHPFTLHASSPNTGERARVAAVKLVRLYEPMNLERQDRADYSPVELAIVEALHEKPNQC
jgi:hypothetical protein